MVRKFFYVSLGILALALAYNLGAGRTEAQSGTFVGIAAVTGGYWAAITSSGDLYLRSGGPRCDGSGGWNDLVGGGCTPAGSLWHYAGNVQGGPVPVEGSSFGAVKGGYKK